MNRRRILLLSLIFSITVTSAVLISYPTLLRPLRRDPIPEGAYVIPWARPNPSIDVLSRTRAYEAETTLVWDIHLVMTTALRLDISYKVRLPNETRVIPSSVYLSHDDNYLYVGGIFQGMGVNPTSENKGVTYSNYFRILFDVVNDGKLRYPESGSVLPAYIRPPAAGDANGAGGGLLGAAYADEAWRDYSPNLGRSAWALAQDICNQSLAVGDYVVEYDAAAGTLVLLFSRRLSVARACANALQMRRGERWAMGFLLELGFSNGSKEYQDFVDGWPRNSYPYLTNDASWWPKMVIDLANPPPGFA